MTARIPARIVFRTSTAVALLAALVMLGSCLPVPLGDPAQAKVDPKFLGAWQWSDGVNDARTNVAIFRAWDERTYVVDVLNFSGDLAAPTPKGRLVFKAWLATVKGKTFINLQQIETLSPMSGEKRPKWILIAKLELEGDRLTATGLDGGFDPFKAVGTTTELEKVVAEHMDDVKMWVKPIVATKVPAEQIEALEKLSKRYEDGSEK